jgi:tetratricopeptide (TPR) repeat protein
MAEAEPLLKEAWEIRVKHSGREDREARDVELGLAEIYLRQAKFAEAEPLFRHLLDGCQTNSEPPVLDLFALVTRMALIERAFGRDDAAERLYRQALALSEEAEQAAADSTPASASTAAISRTMCIAGLASLARRNERFEEAETKYREVLASAENLLPEDNRFRVESMFPLALVLHARGKATEAEHVRDQWLAAAREEAPRGPSGVGQQIVARADVFAEQGQSPQAEEAYWQAFQHAVVGYGADHTEVRALLSKLAKLIRQRGRDREATAIEQLAHVSTEE